MYAQALATWLPDSNTTPRPGSLFRLPIPHQSIILLDAATRRRHNVVTPWRGCLCRDLAYMCIAVRRTTCCLVSNSLLSHRALTSASSLSHWRQAFSLWSERNSVTTVAKMMPQITGYPSIVLKHQLASHPLALIGRDQAITRRRALIARSLVVQSQVSQWRSPTTTSP